MVGMFQFSLKQLLLNVTFFAVACGSWTGASRLLRCALSEHGDDSDVMRMGIILLGLMSCAFLGAAIGTLFQRGWRGAAYALILGLVGVCLLFVWA